MKNLLLPILFCFSLFALAQDATPDDILSELDKNFFSVDMEYDMEMKIYKKDKVKRTYTMRVFKKGNKLRLDILTPNIEKDRKVLNDGENLWMFLPRSSKLIKLPFKQTFMGGDASNRDILRISLIDDYNIAGLARSADSLLTLSLEAKDLSKAYNQVDFALNESDLIPSKQEMKSLSGKVIKTIVYDDIELVNGNPFPTGFTIVNELRKDTKTEFRYYNFSEGESKPDSFFTTAALSK